MLFASRYSELMVIVQSDETEWVRPRGERSALQPHVIQQDISITFRQGMGVPLAARIGALHYFEGNGALMRMGLPERGDGILGTQAYEGFEPERAFGFFDTETMCPADQRVLVEAKLLSLAKGTDIWLYEPEKMKAPWPSYDKIVTKAGFSRQNRADKIKAQVVEGGYSPVDVIAYERENTNDELVVRAMEELIAADVHQRAEDAALEVTV